MYIYIYIYICMYLSLSPYIYIYIHYIDVTIHTIYNRVTQLLIIKRHSIKHILELLISVG